MTSPSDGPSATDRQALAGRLAGAWRAGRGDLLLLTPIVVWGGLLRLEALLGRHGVVPGAAWFEALQSRLAALAGWLQPGWQWIAVGGYTGDPRAYLNNARAMESFYEGRAREPVFNYATQVALWLTDNADIGVSLASTTFSVLCIVGTYLLGRIAFGRFVGAAAALLVALEPTMILWGVDGWRDDAFTLSLLLFASAVLRTRQRWRPTDGLLLGLSGAFALLVRLTALSFVGPGFALLGAGSLLAADDRRRRAAVVAGAGVLCAALVLPYLVNCWMVFDDPLIAINRNTIYYSEAEGLAPEQPMGTGAYLARRLEQQPHTVADLLLRGFTSYPFANKWHGFAAWGPGLVPAIRVLALVGLLCWPWFATGRLLLGALFFSMVPYVFTWDLASDWRFTMHTYPLYLIAAASCVPLMASTWRSLARAQDRLRRVGALAWRAAAALVVLAALQLTTAWLADPVFAEAVASGRNIELLAGRADRFFASSSWFPVVEQAGIELQFSRGTRAEIALPLPPGQTLEVAFNLFPPGRTERRGRVLVFLDERRVGTCPLWRPAMSWCSVRVEPERLETGRNVLELRGTEALTLDEVIPLPEGARPEAETSFGLAEVRIRRIDGGAAPAAAAR